MTASRRWRVFAALLGAVALTGAVSACGGSGGASGSSPTASASPRPSVDGVAALTTGICLTSGSSLAFDWTAAAVDCAAPHTIEVFGVLTLSGPLASSSYASITTGTGVERSSFIEATQKSCASELSGFSGGSALVPAGAAAGATITPYFYGSLNAEPVPQAAWDGGDKRVACYATFGAHGSDEGEITATGPFLRTFWQAPPSNPDVRFCQASTTLMSVSCADPHDREFVGQFLAQDYASRTGFDAATLAAFDSTKATPDQWKPYDQLCAQIFAPLISADGRSDVAVVATTDTTASYWGLGGSYAMQCVASPQAGYVTGSLLGVGSTPLATAAAPSPSPSSSK